MKNICLNKTQLEFVEYALNHAGILGRLIKLTFFERLEYSFLLGEPVREEEDFSNGYVCDRKRSICSLVGVIEKELHSDLTFGLFFNECAKVGDPNPYEGCEIVNLQDEIYHLLRPLSEKEQIQDCIIESESGGFFGVLIKPNEADVFALSLGNVDKDLIHRCVALEIKLIVSVYDGESYLMCGLRALNKLN